jgi:hypothetical protein
VTLGEKLSLNPEKNSGYFTLKPIYIYDINISLGSSPTEKHTDKRRIRITTNISRSMTLFPENLAFYEKI